VAAVTVIAPGLLTTVQDRGRWGHQDRGVPVGGPMDPFGHRVANALAGNAADAATLEITLAGPELVCDDDRVVAIGGAAFEIALDGRAVAGDGPIAVPAGAALRLGRRLSGARAYLAVSGGFDVPRVLGSRATQVTVRMGGLAGRALQAGDRLPLGSAMPAPRLRRFALPPPPRPAVLRVLPGPETERFEPGALERLQAAPYVVAPASNRMGYRLEGPSLPRTASTDIISAATPIGTVQVPPAGQPLLLMADRQTAGGYPRIAIVISADLRVAGQLAPGDAVVFRICSPREALAALIAQERVLMALEGAGAA
jgi:antagonist of KipI